MNIVHNWSASVCTCMCTSVRGIEGAAQITHCSLLSNSFAAFIFPTYAYIISVTNGFIWRGLSFGTSPILPSVNVMEWVSMHLLPQSGILPPIYLLIPAAVGAAVVGSFERRISRWLKSSGDGGSSGGEKCD